MTVLGALCFVLSALYFDCCNYKLQSTKYKALSTNSLFPSGDKLKFIGHLEHTFIGVEETIDHVCRAVFFAHGFESIRAQLFGEFAVLEQPQDSTRKTLAVIRRDQHPTRSTLNNFSERTSPRLDQGNTTG